MSEIESEIAGDFMVRWALQHVTKSCRTCKGARHYVVRRTGKILDEVCGCAQKRFLKAHRDKIETRGDQFFWRKGFIPFEAPPKTEAG